jgi:endoglucanase
MRDSLLKNLLSQPTAPFRERHTRGYLEWELENEGVPFFRDPIGNLIVGVSSKAEYLKLLRQKSKEPVRIFIAHLDHPGFHGVEWRSETELEVRWLGGSPTADLEGASVWLADALGWAGQGTLHEAKLLASGRALEAGVVRLSAPLERKRRAPEIYGGFRFRAPQWQEDRLIYSKAADDLVGAFAIVSTAMDLFGEGAAPRGRKRARARAGRPPFIGLLSRAEEVGFIGTIGHFELGWHRQARRPLLAVSLETSRQLPGAEIGQGPVVRLGDRYTVFAPGCLRVFSDLAEKTLPGKHQRKVMDGGTCEATAATVYGVPAIGISVPLGNYHNQNFEGGPDARAALGPAPEFVNLDDVEGMLALCQALMQADLPWAKPWEQKRESFRKELRKSTSLLKTV